MRSFQSRIGEFDARGIRVVGVSVDPPPVNQEHRRKLGVTFPLLSDVDAQVTRQYDLFHANATPTGADAARPAEFWVDSAGTVRWVNLTKNNMTRTTPDEVLRAIDAAGAAAPR